MVACLISLVVVLGSTGYLVIHEPEPFIQRDVDESFFGEWVWLENTAYAIYFDENGTGNWHGVIDNFDWYAVDGEVFLYANHVLWWRGSFEENRLKMMNSVADMTYYYVREEKLMSEIGLESFILAHESEIEEIVGILQDDRVHRFVSWDLYIREAGEIEIIFQGGQTLMTTRGLNDLSALRREAPNNPVILSFIEQVEDELGISEFQISVSFQYRIYNRIREENVNGRLSFTISR